jgi:hypothetical protein
LTARSGQAELSAMPSMPTFNVSNTKPTFTEISYTKLRTFPASGIVGLRLRANPTVY